VYIELPVDAIHAPGVEKDQRDKNVDRTLLRKPEAELEATDPDAIQLIDKKNPEPVGTGEPDCKTDGHEAKIGSPVGETIVVLH
jgi:hypothetical protein